jgi:hypothetical protein
MVVANASTVADPVLLVSHQASANCTNSLPNHEQAWPVQMIRNGRIDNVDWLVWSAALTSLLGCAMPAKQRRNLRLPAFLGNLQRCLTGSIADAECRAVLDE